MFALFIAVLCLIVYGSLYPWHFAARVQTGNPLWLLLHSWPGSFDRYILRDTAVNIALYAPAGAAGYLAFRRFGKIWPGILAPMLICTVVSGSVEMVQLFVPFRDTSALDLATNIAGSAIGILLAAMTEDVFRSASNNLRKPPDLAALALIGCWIVWLWFPLFPVMGRTALAHKLSIFAHSSVMDPVAFFSALTAWLAAGNLWQAGGLRPVRQLIAISTGFIPAQLFIVDRQPVPAEFAGAVAGAVCFVFLRSWRKNRRQAWWEITAWAFLGMIVIRGLAPFHFVLAATPFSWIPFSGFLNMNWQTGVQVLAEKSFWYGGATWLLRASGMPAFKATALVAGVLLGIEIAQTHLPGRVAEITDPFWAVFMSCAMFIMRERPSGYRRPDIMELER